MMKSLKGKIRFWPAMALLLLIWSLFWASLSLYTTFKSPDGVLDFPYIFLIMVILMGGGYFIAILSFLALCISLLFLGIAPNKSRCVIKYSSCIILLFVSLFYSIITPEKLFHEYAERMFLRQIAIDSSPVVAAIHQYEKEMNQPPKSLDELVPQYLPCRPDAVLNGRFLYVYMSGEKAERFYCNSWVLKAHRQEPDLKIIYLPNPDALGAPTPKIAMIPDAPGWFYNKYEWEIESKK